MRQLAHKRITVTGGGGFLGTAVVRKLQDMGCDEVFVPRSAQYDLRRAEAIARMFQDGRPEVLIHLAARAGGIGLNRERPAELFYDNLIMGMQLIEQARLSGVEKLVIIGTVCAYPKFTSVPFKEDDLWAGYPEETNAPYGLAKKMLLVQSQVYLQQYGQNSVFLLPANLYGPGDNFDLDTSHVIPALIRKMFDAMELGQNHITAWGTGSATREFLYVDDAAEGIILATERYDKSDPVNLGNGVEVSIKDLTRIITRVTGFQGSVHWDTTKPDGQPRRRLDVTRAKREFGFNARTTLQEGLQWTVQWYREHRRRLAHALTAAQGA